ncbi:hypothetical protein M2H10_20860 [Vibrio vulnificus]|nr:hypothetical protein [Vibrio vulnificus]
MALNLTYKESNMGNRYHYNSSGEMTGYSSDRSPVDNDISVLVVIALSIGMAGYTIFNWDMFESPYKYYVGVYYVTIAIPLKLGWEVFYYCFDNYITSYRNLNYVLGTVLGLFSVYAYVRVLIFFCKIVGKILKSIGISRFIFVLLLYLGPLVLILLTVIFKWLFV